MSLWLFRLGWSVLSEQLVLPGFQDGLDAFEAGGYGVRAVSYTHLDVYKRQNMSTAARIPELHLAQVTPVGYQPFMRLSLIHILISSKENWSMVDIYADEGITGTSAEKREDFQRLLADCRRGLIDKVLVKSISRFARNTKECRCV